MKLAQRSMVVEPVPIVEATAPETSGQTPGAGSLTMRAAIISLGGGLFTIDLKSVREVFVIESITQVPGMPSDLAGVTNLRGTVIPLLDLRPMLALNADAALHYAVVVKHDNCQVGILVDRVPEIRTLSAEQFLPAPADRGKGAFPLVSTVVRLGDRLGGLLDVSVVLSYVEGTSQHKGSNQ